MTTTSKCTEIVSECEDCGILASEIDRLRNEITEQEKIVSSTEGGPIKRLMARIFGPLIYDGLEICAYCRYWKAPMFIFQYPGDCRFIIGTKNTHYDGKCHRFTPMRRYMRRVKHWRKKA